MAEILIKAVSARHWNPEKELRACYHAGDPVVVMPDGHAWGKEEGLPLFWVLKIPGVAVSRVESFLERTSDTSRRREWSLDIQALPAGARRQITEAGTLTVTRAQAQNFIRRKVG